MICLSTHPFIPAYCVPRVPSSPQGLRLEEAKRINKSIAALGNCVAALARAKKMKKGRKPHVPFRDSTLTRLLTDSLGGNTKTCLCANLGPSLTHYDETYVTCPWVLAWVLFSLAFRLVIFPCCCGELVWITLPQYPRSRYCCPGSFLCNAHSLACSVFLGVVATQLHLASLCFSSHVRPEPCQDQLSQVQGATDAPKHGLFHPQPRIQSRVQAIRQQRSWAPSQPSKPKRPWGWWRTRHVACQHIVTSRVSRRVRVATTTPTPTPKDNQGWFS